jgi:two-component system sensor histidine kinase YesM
MVATLSMVGGSIYLYAQQIVGLEYLRLNEASLQYQAKSIGKELTELRAFGERLAINSRLSSVLEENLASRGKIAKSIINDFYAEFITSRSGAVLPMEISLVTENGLNIATDNVLRYSVNDIFNDPEVRLLLDGQQDFIMKPTNYSNSNPGVLVYSFQIIFPIQSAYISVDQLDRAVIIFDISETMLYNGYRAFQTGDIQMNIVDLGGRVISSRDKSQLGYEYNLTPSTIEAISTERNLRNRIVEGHFYLTSRISGTDWYLVESMPISSALSMLIVLFRAIVAIISVFSVFMLCAFIYAALKSLKPVMLIKKHMERFTSGQIDVSIDSQRDDEYGRIIEAFNDMILYISNLIDEVKKREREKRLAELDFLQVQINPHFIYNTLTSIRFMLEMGKTEEAGEMIFYFSRLLRETLSRSDEFITLAAEIESLRNYIELQMFRYKGMFTYEYELDPRAECSKIPALLLQPIVENAIFHAAAGKKNVNIKIKTEKCGANLYIHIIDTGKGLSADQSAEVLEKSVTMNRVGLRNVQERIQMNYGVTYGLHLSETPGGGTTVTYHLPFRSDGNDINEDGVTHDPCSSSGR